MLSLVGIDINLAALADLLDDIIDRNLLSVNLDDYINRLCSFLCNRLLGNSLLCNGLLCNLLSSYRSRLDSLGLLNSTFLASALGAALMPASTLTSTFLASFFSISILRTSINFICWIYLIYIFVK